MAMQKADAGYRKKVLAWLGLATVAVLATIQWTGPRFKASLMEREPTEALRLLIPLVYAIPLGLIKNLPGTRNRQDFQTRTIGERRNCFRLQFFCSP
jgi:hypothetical protein